MSHMAFCMIVFSNTLLLSLQNFSQTRGFSAVGVLSISCSSYLSTRTLPLYVSVCRIPWASRQSAIARGTI